MSKETIFASVHLITSEGEHLTYLERGMTADEIVEGVLMSVRDLQADSPTPWEIDSLKIDCSVSAYSEIIQAALINKFSEINREEVDVIGHKAALFDFLAQYASEIKINFNGASDWLYNDSNTPAGFLTAVQSFIDTFNEEEEENE